MRRGLCELCSDTLGLDGAIRLIAEREFGGEDPLKPAIREDLDSAIALVKRVHGGLEEIVGPVALPEVGNDKVQDNLEYIEHFVTFDAWSVTCPVYLRAPGAVAQVPEASCSSCLTST